MSRGWCEVVGGERASSARSERGVEHREAARSHSSVSVGVCNVSTRQIVTVLSPYRDLTEKAVYRKLTYSGEQRPGATAATAGLLLFLYIPHNHLSANPQLSLPRLHCSQPRSPCGNGV